MKIRTSTWKTDFVSLLLSQRAEALSNHTKLLNALFSFQLILLLAQPNEISEAEPLGDPSKKYNQQI